MQPVCSKKGQEQVAVQAQQHVHKELERNSHVIPAGKAGIWLLREVRPLWYTRSTSHAAMVETVALLFLIGAAIGSFLNVAIIRYPNTSLTGRSRCAACRRQLRWWELIPIASFIALRGRCKTCSASLSLQYPVVEAGMGLAAVAAATPVPHNTETMLISTLVLTIIGALMMLFFIDLKLFVLPDALILTVMVAAALLHLLKGRTLTEAVGGAVVGAGTLLFIWMASGGRGIGLGDVKLMIPLGALLGPAATIVALLLAFTVGAVVGVYLLATGRATLKTPVPFGPFLIATAGIVTLIPHVPDYVTGILVG